MSVSVHRVIGLSSAVAEEIRVLMARRMMRQTDLAEALGVDNMWVSRKLRGIQKIDLDELQRFATALGVSVVDLMPKGAHSVQEGGADGITGEYIEQVKWPVDHQPNGQPTSAHALYPPKPADNRPGGRLTRSGTAPGPRRPARMGPPAAHPRRDGLAA